MKMFVTLCIVAIVLGVLIALLLFYAMTRLGKRHCEDCALFDPDLCYCWGKDRRVGGQDAACVGIREKRK